MWFKRFSLHLFLSFLIAVAFNFASSSYILYEALKPQKHVRRTLLQHKNNCGVDFENLNYTIITSRCKGPNYAADRCCRPLKQTLCPYADQFNDLRSDCADIFFSYANLYGKYPAGLFASLCKEGNHGLYCDGDYDLVTPTPSSAHISAPTTLLFLGLPLIVFYAGLMRHW